MTVRSSMRPPPRDRRTPRNLLVTGANGYLGRHLVATFAARGDLRVYATGRQPALAAGSPAAAGVIYLPCDLSDRRQVLAAFSAIGVETIIHAAAAMPGGSDNDDYRRRSQRDNIVAQENLAAAAGIARWRRFIFCSTISVYGEAPMARGGWTDDVEPAPTTTYGQAKLQAEKLLSAAAGTPTLSPVTLRMAGIHGGARKSGVLYRFAAAALAGEPLRVSAPDRRLSLLFIDDAVKAVGLALEHDPPLSGVFNVAGGEATTLLELAHLVRDTLGSVSEIQVKDDGATTDSVIDISRFRATTGYSPTPIRECIAAIARTIVGGSAGASVRRSPDRYCDEC